MAPSRGLPRSSPLVPREVVELKSSVLSGADRDGEPFGLGEALVDVRSVGIQKKLTEQEGAGGGGGVNHAARFDSKRRAGLRAFFFCR